MMERKKNWIPAFAGMTKIEIILWVGFFLAMAANLMAETKTGFSFLKIGVGARAIGMGSAYTALGNDVTSLYWNPAGLSTLKRNEISAMHAQWLAASSFDFLGYGHPVKNGSLAFGLIALTQPAIEERNASGVKIGEFNARDWALSLGYGRQWSAQVQAGLNLKFIESRIAHYAGQGVALDLGGMYHLNYIPLSLGASLNNLGPGIRFIDETTRLPLAVSLGAAYHAAPGLSLGLDVKRQIHDKRTVWSLGTEYAVLPMFTLRGGYLTGNSGKLPAGLGGGFGLRFLGSRLDYALTPFGDLGNTHRVSLSARF